MKLEEVVKPSKYDEGCGEVIGTLSDIEKKIFTRLSMMDEQIGVLKAKRMTTAPQKARQGILKGRSPILAERGTQHGISSGSSLTTGWTPGTKASLSVASIFLKSSDRLKKFISSAAAPEL